jgi:hypothetical protein
MYVATGHFCGMVKPRKGVIFSPLYVWTVEAASEDFSLVETPLQCFGSFGPRRRTIYTFGGNASTVQEPGGWIFSYEKPLSMHERLE